MIETLFIVGAMDIEQDIDKLLLLSTSKQKQAIEANKVGVLC